MKNLILVCAALAAIIACKKDKSDNLSSTPDLSKFAGNYYCNCLTYPIDHSMPTDSFVDTFTVALTEFNTDSLCLAHPDSCVYGGRYAFVYFKNGDYARRYLSRDMRIEDTYLQNDSFTYYYSDASHTPTMTTECKGKKR